MGWRVALFFMAAAAAAAGGRKDVGTAGDPYKLFSGYKFTEGPTADEAGNVYFTDIPNHRIHKVDVRTGALETFLEDSKGCNGLMADGARLVAAQKDEGRLIAIDLQSKKITVLADKFEGNRFIGPNDLVIDRAGGVYFTDPRFPSSPPGFQDKQGVYYVDEAGKVSRVIDDLDRPNGVLLSKDGRTLFVFHASPDVFAYPVLGPGRIGSPRVFCKLDQVPGKTPRGGDGGALANDGTLYITQPDLQAIQVVKASGETAGFIELPGRPTNVDFGGRDYKTLYVTLHFKDEKNVTVDAALYAVKMKKKGYRYGRD